MSVWVMKMPYDHPSRNLDEPRLPRQPQDSPDGPAYIPSNLEQVYEHWMESRERDISHPHDPDHREFSPQPHYQRAEWILYNMEILGGREVTVSEGEVFALSELQEGGDMEPWEAGLFISAVYNWADKEVIHFQEEVPELTFLGYRLKPNKTLIMDGTVADAGESSRGLLVNRGVVEESLGAEGHGVYVNLPGGECGALGPWSQRWSDGRLCINYGNADTIGRETTLPLELEERIDINYPDSDAVVENIEEGVHSVEDLDESTQEYLDALLSGLSGHVESVKGFLEGMRSTPTETIKLEIDDLVGDEHAI